MYKDGGKLMGAEAFSFAIRFIYECMRAWEKDFDEGFEKLFKEIEPAIEDFINLYRQWTPIGVVPKGSGYLQGANLRLRLKEPAIPELKAYSKQLKN